MNCLNKAFHSTDEEEKPFSSVADLSPLDDVNHDKFEELIDEEIIQARQMEEELEGDITEVGGDDVKMLK